MSTSMVSSAVFRSPCAGCAAPAGKFTWTLFKCILCHMIIFDIVDGQMTHVIELNHTLLISHRWQFRNHPHFECVFGPFSAWWWVMTVCEAIKPFVISDTFSDSVITLLRPILCLKHTYYSPAKTLAGKNTCFPLHLLRILEWSLQIDFFC